METKTSADLHPDFDMASFRELTIGELLADPLTRAVMEADHVDAEDWERRFRCHGARASKARSAVSYRTAVSAPSETSAKFALGPFARARATARGSYCTW